MTLTRESNLLFRAERKIWSRKVDYDAKKHLASYNVIKLPQRVCGCKRHEQSGSEKKIRARKGRKKYKKGEQNT